MSWQTPDGDRYLTGHEATLVRETLACVVDHISEDIRFAEPDRWEFGVVLFDELTPSQQAMLIKDIAEHLLTRTNKTLELTATNEAAVYAIFQTLAVQIEVEVDTEDDKPANDSWRCFWRRLTLDAYRECFSDAHSDSFDDDDPEDPWMTPQSEQSPNLSQWQSLTECLADRILWDRDFEMAGSFLDEEPAKAAVLKQMMGIETDYYSSIAPDATANKVDDLLREVRQITHQKPR
jgi:hypothetical protein